jgi:hypothetical protein
MYSESIDQFTPKTTRKFGKTYRLKIVASTPKGAVELLEKERKTNDASFIIHKVTSPKLKDMWGVFEWIPKPVKTKRN